MILIAFKLFGKLDQNPYVTDNDTIYVPFRKNVIQIVGCGETTCIFYELKDEKTLADVVDLSGGFNAATAMKEPIRVIRFEGGRRRLMRCRLKRGTMKDYAILNGDWIRRTERGDEGDEV